MSIAVLQHPKLGGGGVEPLPVPAITRVAGNVAGTFSTTPAGVILHGTRSGQPYSVDQEFDSTVNYVRSGASGLGWNITCGDNEICEHYSPAAWGWNARAASSKYLAVEFAQAHLGDWITDGQVEAFCWYFLNVMRPKWPNLPMTFPNHSDLPEGIADGKSDVDPRGAHSVRDRILTQLKGG